MRSKLRGRTFGKDYSIIEDRKGLRDTGRGVGLTEPRRVWGTSLEPRSRRHSTRHRKYIQSESLNPRGTPVSR